MKKKTQRKKWSNRRLNVHSLNSMLSKPGHGTKIPKNGIKSLKSTSSLKDFYYLRLIVHSNVNTMKHFSKKKKKKKVVSTSTLAPSILYKGPGK